MGNLSLIHPIFNSYYSSLTLAQLFSPVSFPGSLPFSTSEVTGQVSEFLLSSQLLKCVICNVSVLASGFCSPIDKVTFCLIHSLEFVLYIRGLRFNPAAILISISLEHPCNQKHNFLRKLLFLEDGI